MPDPYEAAAARIEAARRARAAGSPAPLADPLHDAGSPRKRPPVKMLAAVLVAIVVVGLLRGSQRVSAPPLPTSCTKAAVAVAPTTSRRGGLVAWSATGPDHTLVVLTVGVTGFTTDAAGHLVPQPTALPGTSPVPELDVGTRLLHCRGSGTFRVLLPVGHYPVILYAVTGTGTSLRSTRVARTELAVTP